MRARDLSLIRARLNLTSLECRIRFVPAGTGGNGHAYQNRFKARLISRSAQIKPLALDEPFPDARECNELRSNTCLTCDRAKEKYIQVTNTNIN